MTGLFVILLKSWDIFVDSVTTMAQSQDFIHAANAICEAGRFIDSKGWVPATSGNFSSRLPDGTIAITTSGVHKGHLQIDDIMLLRADGIPLDGKKPSAEALLHVGIYQRFPYAQSILHPHPINAILVSRLFEKAIVLADYELLKAFHGISTHETKITIPIFPNNQNIPHLARIVDHYFNSHSQCHGYIIAGHGLYTWGESMEETLVHLEALDYLFDCELRLRGANRL